jgi:excisionase family DNA binding protein
MNKNDTSPWRTARQTADYVGVSLASVYRHARQGRLRGIKVGGARGWRFRIEEIDRWLQHPSPSQNLPRVSGGQFDA